MIIKEQLLPGDCLLYFDKKSILDWIIAIKTWNMIAHVEVYEGDGMSVASRNGEGVERYPLRLDGLVRILRPIEGHLELTAARNWFNTVRGQKYDWKGLLCFTLAVAQGAQDRMFCSEFSTRWYRFAGHSVINDDYDADLVAPASNLMSIGFIHIYNKYASTK